MGEDDVSSAMCRIRTCELEPCYLPECKTAGMDVGKMPALAPGRSQKEFSMKRKVCQPPKNDHFCGGLALWPGAILFPKPHPTSTQYFFSLGPSFT